MKKMLFGGLVAALFVAVVADEIWLHRVIQMQNLAMERLSVEVGDLQRASAESGKKLSTARNLALVPKITQVATNGTTTIFGVAPRNSGQANEFPSGNVFLQESSDKVPSSWEPFEFNGRTYYRIPLAYTSPEPFGFRP